MRIPQRLALRLAGALVLLPAALVGQVWEVGNLLLEPPLPQPGASYGAGLAIGDFDEDGVQDLALGSPGWATPDVGTLGEGGWRVYWGSSTRELAATPIYSFGEPVRFGAGLALAAGDFDGDGRDELAIGAPSAASSPESPDAGLVLFGGFESRAWSPVRYLTQEDAPLTEPEEGDRFGEKLAVGDFNGDDYDDLAVAAPEETLESETNVGVVHIFYGDPVSTLKSTGSQTIVSPNEAPQEWFGYALAAGDFDGDGWDDLAIGAPYRVEQGHPGAGVVEVYYGSPTGLDTSSPQVFFEGDFALSAADDNDHFGHSLAAGEFNESIALCAMLHVNCHDDLAIGVPGEEISGQDGAGKLIVVYGSATGLVAGGASLIYPSDVDSAPELGDQFGWALAAGRFDMKTAREDLAIGSPYEDWGAHDNGVAHLVFGSSAGLNGSKPSQFVPQRAGVAGAPAEAGEMFGARLAVGDLDDDGWGDLVVYVPDEGEVPPGEMFAPGAVQILFGALFADGFERASDDGW